MADRPMFRLWLRRDERGAPRYSVRFDVGEGRALIRLNRPGVRLEPPSRRSGSAEGLAPAGLRSATFLHVRGPSRDAWSFERLEDRVLEGIQDTEWRLLEASPSQAGGGRLELPPDEVLPPTQVYRVADLGPVVRDAIAAGGGPVAPESPPEPPPPPGAGPRAGHRPGPSPAARGGPAACRERHAARPGRAPGARRGPRLRGGPGAPGAGPPGAWAPARLAPPPR